MKKEKNKEQNLQEDVCSYISEAGFNINDCEDMPITFCKKCKKFYVLDKEGNREEINIK